MKAFISFVILICFLMSCSTSRDVISEKKFQKRKYLKGVHVDKKSKIKSNKTFRPEDEINDLTIQPKTRLLKVKEYPQYDKLSDPLVLKTNEAKTTYEYHKEKKTTDQDVVNEEISQEEFSVKYDEKTQVNVIGLIGFFALIITLIDFIALFTGLGVLTLLLALVLGIIGMSDRQSHKTGTVYAKIALFGSVGLILGAVLLTFVWMAAWGGSIIPLVATVAAIIILLFLII